jgi:HlyD family secretion protein
VQVGTQVGGIIQELYADFNSIVRKGQVIARLDPTLLQTQIEQQRANVIRAEADLERLRVALADARQKLERARALFEKNLLPRTELETAEVTVRSSEAQIRSSEAALTQARSQLNTAEVNLAHTVITAPIDGIVISRAVEPGQTVNAGMSAPTLFILAADLTKMQVNANIDEADVGRMRPGQVVTFRVDAFPTDVFTGAVEQVRLQPTTVQNVVTYQTVIQVPNPELKLKPGMTATVNIEIARRNNVLRLPAAATRFRPTEEIFAALNQPVPPEIQRGGRNAGGRGGGGQPGFGNPPGGGPQGAAPAGGSTTPAVAPASASGANQAAQPGQRPGGAETRGGGDRGAEGTAGGSGRGTTNLRGGDQSSGGGGDRAGRGGFDPNMTPEERRKRMEERLAAMTPEDRKAFEERMAARGQGGGFGGGQGRGQTPGGGRGSAPGGGNESGRTGFGGAQAGGNRPAADVQSARPNPRLGRVASTPSITSGATTIDSLFGPLPTVETRGRAWLFVGKQLKPVSLRLGISDNTNTEIIDGEGVQQGTEVVLSVILPDQQAQQPGTSNANNPLMGPQRRGGGPGGPGGGSQGGGGRGGR